jgi:hypothetical protein
MSYDLRRLRAHGLITRIPRSHRYRLTEIGLHHAMLLSHIHTRLLQPGLAHLTDPDPPEPSTLRTAAHNYRELSTNSPRTPASPPEHQDLTRSCRRPQQARRVGGRSIMAPTLRWGRGVGR